MQALWSERGRAPREIGRLAPVLMQIGVLTWTKLAGLKHKSKWLVFEEYLWERTVLHQSAERCGIAYRTAFLWRHRFLTSNGKCRA